MPAGEEPRPARSRLGPLAWLLNPYFQILVGAVCDSAGEVLLKYGTTASNASYSHEGIFAVLGVTPLASAWTWVGRSNATQRKSWRVRKTNTSGAVLT